MNQIVAVQEPKRARKNAWQRKQRRDFAANHGYSTASHYAAGGNRQAVLERDGHKCVKCGMTDEEHREKWSRPITIDHKNKDRSNNSMENLQTLCLQCHGNKDLIPRLRRQRVPQRKAEILAMRKSGATYQSIADTVGFSIGAIWKWCQKWEGENA